jgi:hypothetical protein
LIRPARAPTRRDRPFGHAAVLAPVPVGWSAGRSDALNAGAAAGIDRQDDRFALAAP